ncbi:MAG: hypothetical protein PHE78_08625, partial [Candidatus Gastranaerophilales bacterium]|nr:hypothetical protein [Candidatus Gastranaerophilales bacterium]
TQANLEEYAHTQGIKKKIKAMTEQEKVQLRYNYVLSKTAKAQGDFERTGGGQANQARKNAEILKEVGTNMGNIFLPSYTAALSDINAVIIANTPKIISITKVAFDVLSGSIKFVIDNMNWLIPVATSVLSTLLAYNAITGIVSTIKTLTETIKAVNTVQGIWNALLLANPIGMWAVGIGVVVGLVALLVMNWDKVTKAASKAINVMKNAFHLGGGDSKSKAQSAPKSKTLPHHATGTSFAPGGPSIVGEYGPERVVLPRGAQVENARETAKSLQKPVNVYVTIQGNVLGNREYAHYLGNIIGQDLMKQMAAV